MDEAVLAGIDRWPVRRAAAAAVGPDGVLATHGPLDARFALASVTKLLTALAVHVALEEGTLTLDQPAGPPGSTIAHLLAHASGLGPDGQVLTAPATRRIYSNAGYEILADTLESAAGISLTRYLHESVNEPLRLTATTLDASAAHGASSTVEDLARLAEELLRPGRVLHPSTLAAAVSTAFPGLDGVLPGFGAQRPNDWGLGPELRGHKDPHWTGTANAPETFGHFGQSGTFLWVDPVAQRALVVLTDEPFGPWATTAWPLLSDTVLAA